MYSILVFDKGYDLMVVPCQVVFGAVFATMAPSVAAARFLVGVPEKLCDQRFQLLE